MYVRHATDTTWLFYIATDADNFHHQIAIRAGVNDIGGNKKYSPYIIYDKDVIAER